MSEVNKNSNLNPEPGSTNSLMGGIGGLMGGGMGILLLYMLLKNRGSSASGDSSNITINVEDDD
jgi:hypothetical protein